MWIVLVLLVLAAFVPPWINVSRYRLRVVDSISNALGRNVSVSGIEMRLLPRPGVILSGFVVADEPSFSAEPMLRAETVDAYVRLTSLWRGRIEIGTLELDSPSLNLVRRADGHWNVESLLHRTTQVAAAPTTATRSESRTRFPYIEGTAGRINFKLDQVKKAFSFTDANFSLWQESEDQWGVRMKAKPTRTDLALSDTGQLSLDGTFRRATLLRDTPVTLKVEFSKGQLGQITKLIYGRDRGWRGGAAGSASLTGTPNLLSVVLDAQVDDFRRYDIALGEAMRLHARCTGNYSFAEGSISDAVCEAPIKAGV
jgi:AsmA protein